MAVRNIIQIGHPALKAKNKSIKSISSSKTKKLIQDLKNTLKANDLIGIAAQQVGENYKVFVTEARNTPFRKLDKEDTFRVYINPKITFVSHEQSIIWSCSKTTKNCYSSSE